MFEVLGKVDSRPETFVLFLNLQLTIYLHCNGGMSKNKVQINMRISVHAKQEWNIIIPDKTRPTYELKKSENPKKMIEIAYLVRLLPWLYWIRYCFHLAKNHE